MIRILLADDQAIFRAGAARVLAGQDDMTLLGQCDRQADVLALAASARSCILLLAEALSEDFDRIAAALIANGSRIVMILDDLRAMDPSRRMRVDGMISRHVSATDLLACVRSVHTGERFVESDTGGKPDTAGTLIRDSLTPRELEVVGYIVRGWKNRQIAEKMGTKEQVIKNYLRSIYDKTGSSDRLELALFTLHHQVLAEAAARAASES